ncbi:MAG: GxxExxY protein [bacterium]|nr:GxxExxY protein [bacterium]
MLLYEEITEKIIKAFYEVHNELGNGFLENVYENALMIVLKQYNLKVEQQKDINVYFRDVLVGKYRSDIIVEDKIILEIKSVSRITKEFEAQLINYLKATNMKIGLILNFGDKAEFKRLVF